MMRLIWTESRNLAEMPGQRADAEEYRGKVGKDRCDFKKLESVLVLFVRYVGSLHKLERET